jgi:hypothetical protein
LLRTKRYTDYLAGLNPNQSRDLSAWLESGGLKEVRTRDNEKHFKNAEMIFLLKYYRTPEYAPNPNSPTYVIGGPQAVISLDTEFVNRARQGQNGAIEMMSDLAIMEFLYCIEAEQEYLRNKVRERDNRNIFFDNHFSKVGAWSAIANRREITKITDDIIARHKNSEDFRKQLSYYGQTFRSVYYPR